MKHALIEPLESRIAPATLTISSVALPEGNDGTTTFAFVVTLSEAPGADLTVDFATADGSATADSDYTARTGTLTFTTAGALTQTINIDVLGDTVGEDDETFTVNLSNVSAGHTIETATGTGTIQNDAVLTVTKDADLFEGNSGTQIFNYTVSLTEGPLTGDVSADFLVSGTVSENSATPGTDFTATPGTLVFSPGGPTEQTVPVTIVGDTDIEGDETFELRLSNVVGATVANTNRVATIKEDVIGVTQLTTTVVEGSSGQSLVTYQIELGEYAGNFPVKVSYATTTGGSLGTALAGVDYSTTSGTVTFASAGAGPQTVSVPVYGDLVAEASETFTFRVSFDQDIQEPGVTVPDFTHDVTTTIVNDDVSFSIADNPETISATQGLAEGNSGTTQMKFTISMTGAITAPVTVHYRTVDGSGNRGATAASGDFVGVTDATLVFTPGGPTEQDIFITINGDPNAELSESFSVELFQVDAPGFNSSFARAVGAGIIKNDDVSVSLSSLGALPEGQSGLTSFGFRATITQPLPEAVTFSYSTADGAVSPLVLPPGTAAASAATDYVAVTGGTVTIPAGQTSADFFISVRGDATKESDEVFTVTLPSNVADTIIGTGSVLGTILNDDPFLSIGDVTVTEGTGGTATATFVVTLTAAPATGEMVEVKFSTGDGTAISTGANADFTPQTLETLTFDVGETQKTISIDVTGDNRFEGTSEQFSVTLSDAKLITTTGTPTETALTIARPTGTATIVDDDAPTVSITPAVRVAENSGPANFIVSLSNPSDVATSVAYQTANGTATAGSDYTAIAPTTLTFDPGITSRTIPVTITGDTVNEADETFEVRLLDARIVSGAALTIASAIGTGTILNDDLTVSISNPAPLTEDATSMNFTVTLSSTSANPVTVFYTTREIAADNSLRATSGSDFTARSGSIVISAGATTGTISVPILEDTIDEDDQTFEVVLSSATNAAIGGTGVGTGTILDDDAAPTVQIVPALSFNEGSSTSTVNFTVSLSQISERVVSVNYATTPGTAQNGSDFTNATGTLTIDPGQLSNTFAVSILGDTIAEPNETFTATISAPVNATLGTQVTSTATILNDDIAPTLSIADVTGLENAGTFTFNVTLARAYAQAVTVQYTTVDSTALAGSDYTLTTNTLVFAPNQTTQTIVVPIANNDGTPELDERFLVRLSNPTNATLLDGEAVGFIQNDDVAFSVQDLTLAEEGAGNSAQTALVTVTRTGTGVASVQYRTVDGTALSADGRDFTAATGTLNFAAGELSKTIAIPITADSAYEFDEQFTVELFAPVDGIIADDTATVTITDNDVAPTLSATNATFTEGGTAGAVVFTVQLSAANERGDVTLQFETIDGTALSTGSFVDFTALENGVAELRFTQGQTSQTISIPVTNDTRDENDETFTVRLKNANAAFSAGGSTLDLTGTIVDNDDTPTVRIVSSQTVAENESGAASRVFTVQLSAASERTVTVNWSTDASASGPFATAGADYTAVSNALLTFAPGTLTQTFSVNIIDDALDEETERFDVVLANPTNATLGSTPSATATISDNDSAPVMTIGDSSVVEGAAPAILFTVSLSAPSGRVVTVNYSTEDGTATSSGAFADFLAASGATLTFQPGVTSQTISIPILDDEFMEAAEVEADGNGGFNLLAEKFTVKLSALVNAAEGDMTAEGSIFNGSDTTLGLVVSDATLVEGASGVTSSMVFRVQLSAPATNQISFDVSTRSGTAAAGVDFAAIGNAVSIPGITTDDEGNPVAGGTSADISVNINGDATFEATESFFLDLSNFEGDAVPVGLDSDGRLTVRGTILNDDINVINGGRTVQWIDVDGDLVTLTTTRGSLAGLVGATYQTTDSEGDPIDKPWLEPAGTVGGHQLVLLSLLNLGGFDGASITITADPQPGFTGATDGVVNVGEIRAAQRVGGELDWVGVDLVNVTVEGDLSKIVAGDNISDTALRKLDVHSLGMFANAPGGAAAIGSEILGPVGTVLVRGDVGGQLKLIGQEFGRLGSLTIEGALRGGSLEGSGAIIVSGQLTKATIGEIIGGTGDFSGALIGNQTNGGAIGNVTVLGTMSGGSGANSGFIIGSRVGHVKLGALEGGTGADSGSIQATTGNLASLTVEGAIEGSSGARSGRVSALLSVGTVKIGDVIGGTGEQSGAIFALNGKMGNVTVADSIVGGSSAGSGRIAALTTMGTVKIGGSVVGGAGNVSGTVFAGNSIGPVTVADDVIGGGGTESGTIKSDSISSVIIGGDLEGSTGVLSGALIGGQDRTVNNQSVFFGGTIRTFRIGGDIIGGGGQESGIVKTGSITTATVSGDIVGGGGIESGVIKTGTVKTATIGGSLLGGAGNTSGAIEATRITSLSIGGPIVGSTGQLSGAVIVSGDAGKITVGENGLGQSLVGGSGVASGRIQVNGKLSQVILAGDIVGGAASFTGALAVGGELTKATLRGSILGGDAPATGDALQNSGFLQAGLLRSAVLSGSLVAGEDNGAGNTNSGTIRAGRIDTLTIDGDVTGTAAVPAIISGAGVIDSSNVAIKSLLIKGSVSFAEILAGYNGDVTDNFRGDLVSADAQISKVEVRGNTEGLNIVAGAGPGADGRFGDATDALASGFGVRDSSRVVASIASVILKGINAANAASYGIVAQHVLSVKTGPTGVALPGLTRGAGNDLGATDTNDLIAQNFRAVEIPV